MNLSHSLQSLGSIWAQGRTEGRRSSLSPRMSPSRVPLLSCAQIPPSTCYAGYLSHVAQDFDFHLLYCFNYIPISQSSVWALLISCSSMDSQYLQKNKPVDHWVQTETWTLSSEWGTRVNVAIKKWEDMSPANVVLTPKRAPNHLDLLKPHSVTSSFGENKGFGCQVLQVHNPDFSGCYCVVRVTKGERKVEPR